MKVNYAKSIREAVCYEELECGDTYYDMGNDLNIKMDDTWSIYFNGTTWHKIDRDLKEHVYPVKTILNVEN